jgi:lysine-N-methylase
MRFRPNQKPETGNEKPEHHSSVMLKPVLQPGKRLQPRSYHRFRCIGADCEDTCCIGWIVNLDKRTYETYQRCDDPELGPRLRDLVTINPDSLSDQSYARITLSGSGCPFLADGLCSIQAKLGEDYLSTMCARYPRVMNIVDDVLQRSLDLSCPEAARIVLLDANPIQFDDDEGPQHDSRVGHLSVLTTSSENSGKPYRFFREIRDFVIWLLQCREYPLSKRLVILGSFCDELHDAASAGRSSETLEIVESHRDSAQRDLPDSSLIDRSSPPAEFLETVLELIVGRITSDFTPPRFLACYQEFMHGIKWTAQSSMEDLGRQYATVYSQCYAPFMKQHEYMLENYLVNYVYRTLFPLAPQQTNRELVAHGASGSVRDQCLLLMVHYAIIQTVLVGVAGFQKTQFTSEHVVKVIQSFTKAFEHSLTFPGRALQTLAEKNVTSCAALAMLIRS